MRYQFQMSIKFSIFFPNLTRFIFLQIEQVPLLEYRFGGTTVQHVHFSQLGSGISQIGSRVLNLVHLNLVETGPTGTAVAILKF